MIRGIPVKISVETPEGKDVTTMYFASIRRCPELGKIARGLFKKISSLELIEKKLVFADQAFKDSTMENIDEVFNKRSEITDMLTELTDDVETEFYNLVSKGLELAGYDKDGIEACIQHVKLQDLGNIYQAMKTMAPMSDFSKG